MSEKHGHTESVVVAGGRVFLIDYLGPVFIAWGYRALFM